VIDNTALDCSTPTLPFEVDVSSGNATDCETPTLATPTNAVRFVTPVEYSPSLNQFITVAVDDAQEVVLERTGSIQEPLTVQVQVRERGSTVAASSVRVNGSTSADGIFDITFAAFRSRTEFDLAVPAGALEEDPARLVLEIVEAPTSYGLIEPAEVIFDIQDAFIADVCIGDIVVTTQSELEQLRDCTTILGNLTIDPTAISSFVTTQQDDPIVSLQALSSLTTITGNLIISNTTLVNLNGLQQLTVISGSIIIINNNALVSIAALTSITTIGGNINISINTVLVTLFNFGNLVNFNNDNGVTLSNNSSLDCISIQLQLSNIEVDISTGNATDCPTEIDIRFVDLNVCNVWSALDSGGDGVTVVDWDISTIPEGAIFDIRFDTLNIPDSIVGIYPVGDAFPIENSESDPGVDYPVIAYPADTVQLDTGWRGNSFFNNDPVTYPGGIISPGFGQELGFFTKGDEDEFRIIVTGRDPGTLWGYEVRCRLPEDPVVVPLAITSFTAAPQVINAGESSTLAWTITGINPIDLTITSDVGANIGDVTNLDSIVVEPTETTTYTLTAENESGTVTETVTIDVIEPEPIAPTITTFTATPDTIDEGATSTLAWEVTGDEPITLTIEPNVGDVTGLTSITVEPAETTTYALTATNVAGTVIEEVIINVTQLPTTPMLSDSTITFETVPGDIPKEDLKISNQYEEEFGVTFILGNGNPPQLAEVGSPAVAFGSNEIGGPVQEDTVVPGQDTGMFFLTDDRNNFSITEPIILIANLSSPTNAASGQLLDIDLDESIVIEAIDSNGVVLDTITIQGGDDNTGDLIATLWSFNRPTADISSIRFTTNVTNRGLFGFGFDNFNFTSPTIYEQDVEPVALSIVSFTATPDAINAGESSTLAWEVTGDAPITLTIEPDVGDVSGLSSIEVSPIETTTYMLTAENTIGSVSTEATVSITPTGRECDGAVVENQAELEALRGCEIITGDLAVVGSTDIVNLEPLNSLLEVQGFLSIFENSALTSLAGLENLTSVRGRFGLARTGSITTGGNDVLSSIDSLANLATIGGDFYFRLNNSLPSLSLPSLTSVGGNINIARNSSITSIAFDSLVSVGGNIIIGDGNTPFVGVNAATSIDFGNLTSLGDSLNIEVNLSLESVDFGMLSTIPGGLIIAGNDLLTQINFDSLTTIAGNVNFGTVDAGGNDSFVSLAGLDNLTFIGGWLFIIANDSLTTIGALANLRTVGDNINITSNDALLSLAGIENIAGYDNDNRVNISENENLDCTPPPVLPFVVDSSSGNAVDCPTP
ncbi:MAG: hypothetical protein AAF708_12585, partial [Deinococcota bacterium]